MLDEWQKEIILHLKLLPYYFKSHSLGKGLWRFASEFYLELTLGAFLQQPGRTLVSVMTPQMQDLLDKHLWIHILGHSLCLWGMQLSISFLWLNQERRYTDFYRNYDLIKYFKEMKKTGTLECKVILESKEFLWIELHKSL
jgi:hypothetical protein